MSDEYSAKEESVSLMNSSKLSSVSSSSNKVSDSYNDYGMSDSNFGKRAFESDSNRDLGYRLHGESEVKGKSAEQNKFESGGRISLDALK